MEKAAPLKGVLLAIGALALSLSTFMQVLDSSIANVALPYITGDLATSVTEGTWVITLFTVGNAVSLPMTGFFTKRLGSIRTIIIATALFTILSWLCSIAITFPMLVVMRFLQGFVAGPLVPLSQSLMIMTFPPDKRSLAISIWAFVVIIGPVIGPVLGGWLTYNYDWRWIFYINLPVGIFCTLAIYWVFKGQESEKEKVRTDLVGFFLLLIAMTSLQIILDFGQIYDWWRSNTIWFLTVTFSVTFVLFIIWEAYDEAPIIDFRFFKDWNFSLGTFLISISYMLFFGTIVITPLWLQDYMGYTAVNSGIAVSTMGLGSILFTAFVPKLMKLVDAKYLVMLTFAIFGACSYYFSCFTTDVSEDYIAFSRFLFGIGIVFYMAPVLSRAMINFSGNKLSTASGIFHFFRVLMGGVGTALFTILWERRRTFHHSNITSNLNDFNPLFNKSKEILSSYGIKGQAALEVIDESAWKQAAMLSLNDVFYLAAIFFGVLVVSAYFFKNKKSGVTNQPAESS